MSNLRSKSQIKSIQTAFLFGIGIPIIILEIIGIESSKLWYTSYIASCLLLIPIVYLTLFQYEKSLFKCPSCNSKWTLKYSNSKILDVTPVSDDNYRTEKYAEEYICSSCNFKKLIIKTKKIKE